MCMSRAQHKTEFLAFGIKRAISYKARHERSSHQHVTQDRKKNLTSEVSDFKARQNFHTVPPSLQV